MNYKHFTADELSCNCCGESRMDDEFMRKLEAMREAADFPFSVTSAYRCPTHNTSVSKTGPNGPHTTGRAVDVSVARGGAYRFLELAFKYGMTGIGVKQNGNSRFIHVDDLDEGLRPTVWSY